MFTQNQNDYLEEYCDTYRDKFLHKLLQMEARRNDFLCVGCKQHMIKYRCLDCHGYPELCQKCLLDSHCLLPNHTIAVWTGDHFQKTSLFEAGYTIHMGHSGSPCPNQTTNTDLQGVRKPNLTVVDIGGVFNHFASYCQCVSKQNIKVEPWAQLFESGLFPASTKRPGTVFTFALLDHFDLDNMECQTSAMCFMSKLARLTNGLFPDEVPVRTPVDFPFPSY